MTRIKIAEYQGKILRKPAQMQRPERAGNASTHAAGAPRMPALSKCSSETALGAYFRHIAQRSAGDLAVFRFGPKAGDADLLTLPRWGQPYVYEGAAAYEKAVRLKTSAAANSHS